LESVHRHLQTLPARSAEDMAADYGRLIPARHSAQRYFRGPTPPPLIPERRLQLYWRALDRDFSEENSFAAAPRGTERQLLWLHFPGQRRAPHELRLDLSLQPGFLSLHQISLLNFLNETVWSWNGEFSTWDTIRSTQLFSIKALEKQSGSFLYLTGDDPWLILPVPVAVLETMERGGSVAVDLTIGNEEGYASDLAAAQMEATAWAHSLCDDLSRTQKEIRALQEELDIKSNRLAELEKTETSHEQYLRSSEAQVAALQSSVSWQVTKPFRAAARLGRKMLGRSRNQL
jgi:hypothetical protein